MENLKELTETYNSLQRVEIANEKLQSLGQARILSTLGEIILNHNLQDVVGIRLLHNHNE